MVYFHFHSILKVNSGNSDQTPLSTASDLGMYCLPLPHIIKETQYVSFLLPTTNNQVGQVLIANA